jgi:hypothetical protein
VIRGHLAREIAAISAETDALIIELRTWLSDQTQVSAPSRR